MPHPLPFPPLLLITDRRQATRPLDDLASELFEQGLRWISVREKDLDAGQLARLLRTLSATARPHGAVVGLHADLDLALKVREAGGTFTALHLPDGANGVAARQAFGPHMLIGQSRHPETLDASPSGALDYVTLSPVHPTASKPGHGPAIGPEGLRRLVAASPVPVVALGGITPENLQAVMDCGPAGVAVMGAPMRDPGSFAVMARGLGVVPARPAVSVLPVRDAADGGGIEVMVIRRNSNLAFAPGAIAFPGGRVDQADGPPGLETTRRVAVLRELKEECGLAPPAGGDAATALVPLCRFITPLTYPRRFDTWFYLLPAPADFTPQADGGEVVEASWASPAKLLAEAANKTITLMFATWLILDRLARAGNLAAAIADAHHHPVVPLTAVRADSDGVQLFRIPDGLGFALTELRFDALGKI